MGFPSNNHSNEKHKFTILGLPQAAIAVIASLAWMGVSSGLIMLNKNLLSNGFPYPMALSGLGMAFSWVASYVTIHHLKLVELNRTVPWNFWLRKILPIGLLMALTLGTGKKNKNIETFVSLLFTYRNRFNIYKYNGICIILHAPH